MLRNSLKYTNLHRISSGMGNGENGTLENEAETAEVGDETADTWPTKSVSSNRGTHRKHHGQLRLGSGRLNNEKRVRVQIPRTYDANVTTVHGVAASLSGRPAAQPAVRLHHLTAEPEEVFGRGALDSRGFIHR